MSETPKTDDTMVAALLREREGLKQLGKDERVGQVDEQLRLRGYSPDGQRINDDNAEVVVTDPPATPVDAAPAVVPEQRTEPPKGRRARGSEQA